MNIERELTEVAQSSDETTPNFCLLIDELLSVWRVKGNDFPTRARRVIARIKLERAIERIEKLASAVPDADRLDAARWREYIKIAFDDTVDAYDAEGLTKVIDDRIAAPKDPS